MPFNWNSVAPLVNSFRTKKITEKSPQLERFERGIWKICMVKDAPSRRDVLQSWKDVIKATPLLKRLFLEVFAMDPWLTLIFVSSRMWSALETAITLYLSGRLLKIIEDGLRKRRPNVPSILRALLLRLIFHVASRISSRALCVLRCGSPYSVIYRN
ncbi:hypothetical protein EDD85DRAFT_158727 [Armillaria nabsnona]|nr:hypothetical protein EDD85DRAFT_158727 [Armillaria nabsnona]